MNPADKFDLSAFPITLAIIGALTIIYLALRSFNKKFPQVGEWIMDRTPWMEWAEYETETDTLTPRIIRHYEQ